MAVSANSLYFMALWALAFGLIQTILHALVLMLFGPFELSSSTLLTVMAGFPGQAVTGMLLVIPLWFARKRLLQALAFLPTVLVVLFNMFAFHYEAVFGYLPGASVLYYLKELNKLRSSLSVEAPLGWITGELLLIAGTLGALMWYIQRLSKIRSSAGPGRFYSSIVLASACLFFTLIVHIFSGCIGKPGFSNSQIPMVSFLRSFQREDQGNLKQIQLSSKDILYFHQAVGSGLSLETIDQDYPLCRTSGRQPEEPGNGASVIFLILESVGMEEIDLEIGGRPLMPNLRRIAGENLSFTNFFSSGTQTCQSLPALFSGVPGQTAEVLLWNKPLNTFEGFPETLKKKGYRTCFFHGADLSFEQKRQFLEMVGFEELYEYDPTMKTPVYGWGYSDREMFQWFRQWIEQHHKERGGTPYFATLYTLSTHHPFALPEDWEKTLPGEGKWRDFYETMRFLDKQLGKFYDWFLEEASASTILVITSDHSPLIANTRAIEKGDKLRFDIPLIIRTPDGKDHSKWQPFTNRYGGQHDIPATILDLLDLQQGRCDSGVSLVSLEQPWPEDRLVYGVGGRELSQVYVWSREGEGFVDVSKKNPSCESLGHGGSGKNRKWLNEVSLFVKKLLNLSHFLVFGNAFAPPSGQAKKEREPLPRVKVPIFAAQGGNVDGMLPLGKRNRLKAIEHAVTAGFEWVEIDVSLTKDRVAVLLDDKIVADHDNKKYTAAYLTLSQLQRLPLMGDITTLEQVMVQAGDDVNLLIEARPQVNHVDEGDLAKEIARVVREKQGGKKIIIVSQSLEIASSIKKQCSCPVGLELPQAKSLETDWLNAALLSHLDWVKIDQSMAAPEAVEKAHKFGLKVMVTNLNDFDTMEKFAPEFPDGIITDYFKIVEKFRIKFGS